MDIASSSVSKDGKAEQQLKNCQPLQKCTPSSPFAVFWIWVSKSARNLSDRACFTSADGPARRRLSCFNRLEKGSVLFCPWGFSEEGELGMEGMVEKRTGIEGARDGSGLNDRDKVKSSADSVDEESSETSMSEPTTNEEMCPSSSASSSPRPAWPIQTAEEHNCSISHMKAGSENNSFEDGSTAKQSSKISATEMMMMERFAKLLLGEDMSGSGKGVCAALAISNAITNLCATLFGQLWRLEPLTPEKKSMWQREMQMLLCVSDHIVEFIPSWQTFPDGRKVEVMTCQPRSDLYINLPALRKLDNMLLDILDCFSKAEFWYADQGILAPESDGSTSFRRSLQRQEKWWLPVPSVPPGGLDDKSRKQLEHKRECTSQILKAAMAINNNALAEMEVPESYLENLPKYGRASLGDVIHRYITSDQFNPECLLDCLDLSSEHQGLEFANRVEASIYIWRRRTYPKPINNVNRFNSKSSWEMVKDFVIDLDKRDLLADRAEGLLLCLKQRFPGLPQTALDTSKIQFNKDVGKSILEAYSRVLESIAFNIVARIDDLLCTDNLAKHSDQFSPIPKVVPQKRLPLPYSVPVSSTPYKTASATPSFSPAPLVSPAIGERLPLINGKSYNRGFSVKRVLTDYLGVEVKGKNISNAVKNSEMPPS